ncbi:Glucosamine kinase GspK [Oceanobacillus picturae]|uniref:Glucosamine kinase GspK n=1 Tax=Oceanobacillus picturae TaxID=171693 RepID=W9BA20_9BACI|nr:BadF/BadG/BcrA/BcrD ATPase family protein [Oceanobacillus picturae]CDO03340.1 Glucosamine kinase GspK [Oceanobacillus picturae]
MAYYIGIDGGGTKTNAVLADEKGNILSQAISGASNPNAVGEQELSQVFQTLFLKLDNEGKTPLKNVKWVYAGIAGSANPANRTLLESILSKLLPHATVFVEPDAVCALYSGTYGGAGIVQIAGTGSITYGMNEAGDQGRVGGWGYLFGDEGSGYAIGRAGVTEALKSVDGRGEPTILLEMLYEHFQVSQAQELIKKVYNAKQPKTIIAPLSRIVFQAYAQEDLVAQAILQQAAKDIASQIMALYRTLFTGDEKTKVVLCGGVFQEKAVMPFLLKDYLENIPITLVQPEFPPVAGSLIGAYKQATIQVSRNMLEQMKNTQ